MSPEESSPEGEVRWIECPGCDGEIGVPHDRVSEAICCPNCAAKFKVDGEETIFWRPKQNTDGCTESEAPPLLPLEDASGRQELQAAERSDCSEIQTSVTRAENSKLPVASTFDGPGWMQPTGLLIIAFGVIAAFISGIMWAAQEPGAWEYNFKEKLGVFLLSAAMNPFLFVGVPLGVYWFLAGRPNRGYYCPHCQHKIRWQEPAAVVAKPGAHVACKICKGPYICPPVPPDVPNNYSVAGGFRS